MTTLLGLLVMTWNLGTDSETAIINKTGSDTRRVYVTRSDDNGATWTSPSDITASAKLPEWGWYATGPGGGIQLRNGPHAGRLVVACDHSDAAGAYKSHVIFSDDAGATWQLGGVVPDVKLNECQAVDSHFGAHGECSCEGVSLKGGSHTSRSNRAVSEGPISVVNNS